MLASKRRRFKIFLKRISQSRSCSRGLVTARVRARVSFSVCGSSFGFKVWFWFWLGYGLRVWVEGLGYFGFGFRVWVQGLGSRVEFSLGLGFSFEFRVR
jgi:hypothetical protein